LVSRLFAHTNFVKLPAVRGALAGTVARERR
jgi:hypothetical protein